MTHNKYTIRYVQPVLNRCTRTTGMKMWTSKYIRCEHITDLEQQSASRQTTSVWHV